MSAGNIHILFLDRYRVDDSAFIMRLGRFLASPDSLVGRLIIVHGAGEQAARRIEGIGASGRWEQGIYVVETQAEAALLETEIRECNKRLSSILTEAGVPAVGFQGPDRGIFTIESGGSLRATPRVIEQALGRAALPVVSALARDGDSIRLLYPAAAIIALAASLGEKLGQVVMLTVDDRPVKDASGRIAATVSTESGGMLQDRVHDVELILGLLIAGIEVGLATSASLMRGEDGKITRVVTSSSQ